MRNLFVTIVAFMTITLLSSFLNFTDSRTPSTKMAHKICGEIGKKLKSKYGVKYFGISEEGPSGKYITIGFELSYHRVLTKDEGRLLLLNCAHDALEVFNSYPQFKPYMANVPFTVDNILINIFIQPPTSWDVYFPDITIFSFSKGYLEYYTKTPQKRFGYYTEEEESYEDALKIVEMQRNGELPFSKT